MAAVGDREIGGVLSALQEVSRARIAPAAAEVDRSGRFPEESVRALGDAGAMALLVPSEHGGEAARLAELVVACEAVGAACASTGMVFVMHTVAGATMAVGGGRHSGALLGRMARGEALGTLAFSERGTGAHFYAPELRATRRDGGVVIDGRKTFVTSGGHADVMLVLVRGDGDGLDCYAVERAAPGVASDGRWEGLGMRGNSSIGVNFDSVAIDESALVGAPGAGGDLVFGVVAPTFLAGLAAVNVGIARSAAEAATAHVAARRYSSGGSLAEVQVVQHALADMDLETGSARALVREAAALGDAGDPTALVALMEAKVLATDTAARVTQQALEVCGGQGYTPALPIERHLRDARAGAVMAPTNGVLRTWIGKALAGLPVP